MVYESVSEIAKLRVQKRVEKLLAESPESEKAQLSDILVYGQLSAAQLVHPGNGGEQKLLNIHCLPRGIQRTDKSGPALGRKEGRRPGVILGKDEFTDQLIDAQ